ncbi:unnamed protein product [Rhizoctonia solani]|uniref:Uncharacterized protein n=1 Tax=Rhizoctonia solani TaxID=456999 RepID=A0A8H2XE00_9AGAM|nr:unnamed protein product [Rhizoctonia solani]
MADDAAGRHKLFAFIADLQQRVSADVGLLGVTSMTGLSVYNCVFRTTAYSEDQIEDVPTCEFNESSPQIGKLIE